MRLFGRERREDAETDQDATAVAIARMQNEAAGATVQPEALAVLEIAAGFVGRAFASAAVEGPEAARLLTRELLALVGRSLVLRGEVVLTPEEGALLPASGHDIRGGHRVSEWAYRLDLAGPSRTVSRFLPGEDVLHFRVNTDPSTPWRGRPAHALASATAATAANAERTAGQEAKIAISRLVPSPQPLTPRSAATDQQHLRRRIEAGRLLRPVADRVPPGGGRAHVAGER